MKIIIFLILFFFQNQLNSDDIDEIATSEFKKILCKWKLDRIRYSDGRDPWELIKIECENDANNIEQCKKVKDLNYGKDNVWLILGEKELQFHSEDNSNDDCSPYHVYGDFRMFGKRFWKYVFFKRLNPEQNKLLYKPYERVRVFSIVCTGGRWEWSTKLVSYEIVYVERLDEIFILTGSAFYIYRREK